MKEYLQESQEVLESLKSQENGLSSAEASARLEQYGKNKLKEGKKTPLIVRFLEELKDPMIIILIVAALISGVTAFYSGESFADVIIILIVVIINAVLGVVQESKAEKAIAALQEITAATSKVIRDGHQVTVKSEELVPGDVIVLEAGDAVPADARVLESASMKIEEAALTGESVPVNKKADVLELNGEKDIPLGDRKNMMYMGSTVVYGRGRAVVTGTGMNTEMGKIADALANAKDDATPLQIKLNQLSKILTILVIGICAIIFAVDLFRAYPDITGEGMLDTFMVAVSLAVAAIPEGLAAVVTIVLSIGVTKMSQRNAVIRKLTAVETLGCTQIICSDKTGTLTQNKMTVVEHSASDEMELAKAMALCSDAEQDETGEAVGEPTECALVNDATKMQCPKNELKKEYPRIMEAPFDSGRKMMSTVHQTADGTIVQFTKGAPDEILKRCTNAWVDGKVVPMTEKMREEILAANKGMADQALRVLAAAKRMWDKAPENSEPAFLEQDLCFVGLSGMIDPIRPEVKDAIEECRSAGIRPIMITGDHKDTAVAIAKQLGIIKDASEAITGSQLNEISDSDLDKEIEKYSVYARVQPEHKVRIVDAWKKKGKITAMTGDGVNDAPALKAADIGCAMGITGTDVAKGAADMTLTDDNFATIVDAVKEGRGIYSNIKKVVGFLLGTNISEVIVVFLSMCIWQFSPFISIQLLWINLIGDSLPAIALGMEKLEPDVMDHKPRSKSESIFAHGYGIQIVLQGCMFAGLSLASYCIARFGFGLGDEACSAATFFVLALSQTLHAYNMRSGHSLFKVGPFTNKFLNIVTLIALALIAFVMFTPGVMTVFGFGSEYLPWQVYVIGIGLSIVPIIVMEIAKSLELVRHHK